MPGLPPMPDFSPIPGPEEGETTARIPVPDGERGRGGTPTATVRRGKSRKWLRRTIVTVSGVVIILGCGLLGAHLYYQDRVAPGVMFAGMDMGGVTREEAMSVVENAAAGTRATVVAANGRTVDAGLSDLGASVDVDGTVARLMDGKPASDWRSVFVRLNPGERRTVGLDVHVDEAKLADVLDRGLVGEDQASVPASVRWDDGVGRFVAVQGRDGESVDVSAVGGWLERVNPGEVNRTEAKFTDKPMPVSDDTARTTADELNHRTKLTLKISNGQKKTFTIPATEIHNWITTTPNTATHGIDVTYDQTKIKDYLDAKLPDRLNQPMVKARTVNNPDGSLIRTEQQGTDGISVEDTTDTARQVADALRNGEKLNVAAKTTTTKYETETRTVDYTSPNGDPHAIVNLSEQKAYAYKGSTLVNTFPISSGKPSTPSDTGTFTVNIKNRVMTMRGGSGADAYVTPNVQWVSFYNGGEGFHSAPWNPDGIAKGIPRSHGCINMNPTDAKWMYDFLPQGSRVEVVGNTPDGAVR